MLKPNSLVILVNARDSQILDQYQKQKAIILRLGNNEYGPGTVSYRIQMVSDSSKWWAREQDLKPVETTNKYIEFMKKWETKSGWHYTP